MTLPEAYCRVNRARGVELISPEDLVEACHKLDKVDSPMRYYINTLKFLLFSMIPYLTVMRNKIAKNETNFLGKNQAAKLGIEPATFRATAKHAAYCATEATI
jgi:hypothetical protein